MLEIPSKALFSNIFYAQRSPKELVKMKMLMLWSLKASISTKLPADAETGSHAQPLSKSLQSRGQQTWSLSVFASDVLIGTCLFVSVLSMVAFGLQWQDLVTVKDNCMMCRNPKIVFIIWPFTGKVCQLLLQRNSPMCMERELCNNIYCTFFWNYDRMEINVSWQKIFSMFTC